MEPFDDNDEIEYVVSSFTVDSADYFATVMAREFPRLTLEMGFSKPWRPLWRITLPPQGEYALKDVDDLAFELMSDLFWDQSMLISYIIVGSEDDERATPEQVGAGK